MKSISIATGALLAAVANAATPKGVVQWDIGKRQDHPRLVRRSDTDQTTIANNLTNGGYFATCQVGTPPQTLTLQLDTGSSDIWVPASNASVCRATKVTGGCSLGSFNAADSSTFKVVGPDLFSISYVDGSHSDGSYFTDVFTIGSSTLTNMTMGLGQDTDINFGLVGIGYKTDEAIVSTEEMLTAAYNNLPIVMVNEGDINTVAYSLWLNDLDASTGQLLFGGIDTDKYHGDLTKIDIYKNTDTNTYTAFVVALTSVKAVSSSGSDTLTSTSFPVAVVLDSGTTLMYLPQDLAEEIWTEAGAVYNSDVGSAIIPCSRADSGGHFTFGFGGPDGASIDVSMDELVLDLFSSGTATFSSGQYKGESACQFGIQNTTDGTYLLGDTFLRSAYVVYDLVNNQIALAQTDFNATSSNIVAFASYGAPIPSATEAPNQSEVTQTTTFTTPAFVASSGFASTATATTTSSSSKSAAGTLTVPTDLLRVGVITATMFIAGGLLIL